MALQAPAQKQPEGTPTASLSDQDAKEQPRRRGSSQPAPEKGEAGSSGGRAGPQSAESSEDRPVDKAPSSKQVRELHAERNRQAQRRYRQRQREKLEELHARLTVEQGENAEISSRTKALQQTLKLRKEELRQLRARQTAETGVEEDTLLRQFSGSITLTFSADRVITLTPEQECLIQGLSEKDLARTWSLYVKELAVLLLVVEGREVPQEVLPRIQALLQHELLSLYFQAALTNTMSLNRFVASAVVENAQLALGSESPAMWRRVAAAIQLTQQQRAEIVQLWRAFREKLAGLVPARAEIHSKIANALPRAHMCSDFAIQFLAAHEGMDALQRNLRSEHVLIHEFLCKFYMQARSPSKLTVLQAAHCVVRSFPYFPDILAIVLWVAAAENDACAISVLQHVSPAASQEAAS